MITALSSGLIRLAGADARRVLGLARALDHEAAGQRQWRHAQEGGGILGPEGGRRLALAVMVLASGGVASVVHGLAATAPWLAATVMMGMQLGAVVLLAARDAVPLILADDDRRLRGWWPLSERELLLARGVLLLRRVATVSAAAAVLPLIALVAAAKSPVAIGAGALVGLVLHTLTLASGLGVALQGLARLCGRGAARRLVELAGVLLILGVANAGGVGSLLGGIWRADETSGWALLTFPMAWFAAWADLAGGARPVQAGAAAALATGALLLVGGVRWLGRARRVETEAPGQARRRVDWTRPIAAWLGLWLSGREGRVVLLQARAHLRADWRLTGQLISLPPLLVAVLWLRAARSTGHGPADPATDLALLLTLLAMSLGAVLTFTGDPRAAWLVGGGVLDGRRLLGMHRRLVRALVTVPFLPVAAAFALGRGGLDWLQATGAVIAAVLAAEVGVLLVQCQLPAVPFSRAWRRGEQTASRQLFWLLVLVWPAQILWQHALQQSPTWGWPLSVVVLAVAFGSCRGLLVRRIARRGLHGLSPRR